MSGTLVVTGAGGFLGWHVRVLAHALQMPEPVIVGRDDFRDPNRLVGKLNGVDRVLHLAGVNRGAPQEVTAGNIEPAQALALAVRQCPTPPKTVVFANSIQAGNGSPYGDSKAAAADILVQATQWTGSTFADLRLPNLFGEHGRPHYNSVVATFCRLLADGAVPQVHEDRDLELLHATDAAALLLGPGGPWDAQPVRRTVKQLAERLHRFATCYRTGEIPDLASRFDVRLFNTYRSYCFPGHYPLPLEGHADDRGELIEAVKVRGGGGQTFCSTTRPGAIRGEHYHLAKVERFMVLRGEADICLRRVLHNDVVRFRVSGTEPVVVDMPTMWAHNITNIGDGELLTLFWANQTFNSARPDTYPEKVSP
ncbi:polysaccharide biosynthesis C-terminal domain-containing protein [Micromonospora sp. CPCC 206061]|uniref:polysaccharide biosynthesis C-terminal domain-containing protein n=1 Tax=Micromonospora sp. CPCC 206061 TaxID=3122410 RepID=UPI002FEF0B4D